MDLIKEDEMEGTQITVNNIQQKIKSIEAY
jgi:hypothetical protein